MVVPSQGRRRRRFTGKLDAGFGPVAVALTTGAVPCGAITTGTIRVAGADCGTLLRLPRPDQKENVRFCAPAIVGTTKVGLRGITVAESNDWIARIDDLGPWNGPVGGLLPVPSSVTVTPANGGFGLEVNFGTASVVIAPGTQVSGGNVLSGNGFSCPITWLG